MTGTSAENRKRDSVAIGAGNRPLQARGWNLGGAQVLVYVFQQILFWLI
jgi:hypothetical protein